MKKPLQLLNPLLFFLFFTLCSYGNLFGQWPPQQVTGVVGMYSATNMLNCPTASPPAIDWGNGCITPLPTNNITFYQYQTCGTYDITAVCLGSNTATAPVGVTVTMPSLTIEQEQQTIQSDNDGCGRTVELTFNISNDNTCGSNFNAPITIVSSIPTTFDVVDAGLFTVLGQQVTLTIPANAILNEPDFNTYTIRIRPKYCTPTTIIPVNFSITVPNGFGLGTYQCTPILAPPTVPNPPNTLNYTFLVRPEVPCLQVQKTTSTPVVPFGGTAQFTVTVQNTGNVTAENFVLSDFIGPAGLIPTSFPLNSTLLGTFIQTDVEELAQGSSLSFYYTYERMEVPCAKEDTFFNTVWASDCDYTTPFASASVVFEAESIAPNAAFTYDQTDCNSFQFLPSVDDPNITHGWSFGDGNSSMLTDPYHDFEDGMYTVVHTVTECGITSTSTQTVTVDCPEPEPFSCACGGFGALNIDAGSGTPVSAIPELNNLPNNELNLDNFANCIAIKGKLIIDKNLKIIDPEGGAQSVIYMQPCSKIEILEAAKLSIVFCNIQSCTTMWRGITVLPRGRLELIANTIADAQFAVTGIPSEPGGLVKHTSMYIQRNHFVNNHVGVRTLSGSSASALSHMPFVANKFYSTAPLLPSCDALDDYDNQSGYIGVLLFNNQFTVGHQNHFELLRNGIVAQNCRLNVQNCVFKNIIGTPDANPTFQGGTQGVGISARDAEVKISNNIFDKVHTGVFTFDNPIEVISNAFTGVVHGVYSRKPWSMEVRNNDSIQFRELGIAARDIYPVLSGGIKSRYFITNNVMKSTNAVDTQSDRWAIEITNIDGVTPKEAEISGNIIGLNDNVGGIQITRTNGWSLYNNRLAFLDNPNATTINTKAYWLEYSSNNILYGNIAAGAAIQLNNAATGFRTDVGQMNLWCCNYADLVEKGFEFSGMCLNTDFKHNAASNTLTSLRCTDATQLSEQDDKGNLFFQGSGTAVHEGEDNDVQLSQFIVYDANMDGLVNDVPYSPENILAITEWFVGDDNFDGNCQNDTTCDFIAPERPGRTLTTDDVSFSNSTAENTARGLVRHWESGLALYGRIQSFSAELMGVSPDVDAFYQDATFGALGAFWRMDHNLRQIYVLPDAWQQDVQQAVAKLDSIDWQVSQTLSQLATASSWIDSLTVYSAADSINQKAVASIEILTKTNQLARQFASSLAESLLMQGNDLPETNLVEKNRKTVLNIYATLVSEQRQILTTPEFLKLDSIAHQCPLEGGSTVYMARSLYQLFNRKFFDDDLLCAGQSRQTKALNTPDSKNSFVLAPNPASDQIQIIGLDPSFVITKLQVFQVDGRLCSSRTDVDGTPGNFIHVSSWPSGFYFAVIQTSQGDLQILKFVVQH